MFYRHFSESLSGILVSAFLRALQIAVGSLPVRWKGAPGWRARAARGWRGGGGVGQAGG